MIQANGITDRGREGRDDRGKVASQPRRVEAVLPDHAGDRLLLEQDQCGLQDGGSQAHALHFESGHQNGDKAVDYAVRDGGQDLVGLEGVVGQALTQVVDHVKLERDLTEMFVFFQVILREVVGQHPRQEGRPVGLQVAEAAADFSVEILHNTGAPPNAVMVKIGQTLVRARQPGQIQKVDDQDRLQVANRFHERFVRSHARVVKIGRFRPVTVLIKQLQKFGHITGITDCVFVIKVQKQHLKKLALKTIKMWFDEQDSDYHSKLTCSRRLKWSQALVRSFEKCLPFLTLFGGSASITDLS